MSSSAALRKSSSGRQPRVLICDDEEYCSCGTSPGDGCNLSRMDVPRRRGDKHNHNNRVLLQFDGNETLSAAAAAAL
eukprot:CAMPEP_0172470144 /NCGR_PEP_ID=MMETSP1065-20121228/65581_1 /TAXON_ID=265537 /ORGANISM="Amphiprora paludosa, Strain CCMP125" /LENGTH=76 /DNA_ID=CAMNT_0013227995 /DNA_START=189 /DNA_END=419 /DNA_ORIENTATION=+